MVYEESRGDQYFEQLLHQMIIVSKDYTFREDAVIISFVCQLQQDYLSGIEEQLIQEIIGHRSLESSRYYKGSSDKQTIKVTTILSSAALNLTLLATNRLQPPIEDPKTFGTVYI